MQFSAAFALLWLSALANAAPSPGVAKPPCFRPYTQNHTANAVILDTYFADGMARFKVGFNGTDLIANYGQDFLTRLRCQDGGGIANNWQCYQETNGQWVWESTEVPGPAGQLVVQNAVQDVIGKQIELPH